MRDEEFLLKGRGAMVFVGLSLLVIVVAVVWLFLGLGDSSVPCVAVPFGFLALIISLRVMLDDDLGTIRIDVCCTGHPVQRALAAMAAIGSLWFAQGSTA